MLPEYDIIVVGAGHAGCEAAAAAANMGSNVLLITMNMQTIAQMSCNPAMGGIAKGQIIREIDALGGHSGMITDKTMIQFRMLNRSKGPAVWSPRAQSDRMRFAEEWRLTLEKIPRVEFRQDMVSGIMVRDNRIRGITTGTGLTIHANAVILTNGTFLNGLIHIGEKQFSGGRAGERSSVGITEQLLQSGFESGRMKTGTPPRIDGRSLDFDRMEEQKGDQDPGKFSYLNITEPLTSQRSCHITYTNKKTHQILQTGFNRSPLFQGRINGAGPRYCPSIEDKIHRFAERERHQIFVEPEGWNTIEYYVNGFSTSLPEEVQYKAIRCIPGFEKAKMFRPGYAIEYDFFFPTQIRSTLETKLIQNLYFAGQINGTTGYEEAACQGLMAGINAHLKVNDLAPFTLERDHAYIGVLIDDLIHKGTQEPYRMFTSRAEYRLLLRQDNADLRLTEKSFKLGLAGKDRLDQVLAKKKNTKDLIQKLHQIRVSPDDINNTLLSLSSAPIKDRSSLYDLLKRPELGLMHFNAFSMPIRQLLDGYAAEVTEQTEIQIKYETYIQREQANSRKMDHLKNIKIKPDLNYDQLSSLSAEAKEKLGKIQPETLGHASRISGVSPADISILMVYLGR